METANLIYHFSVMIISIVFFFMKLTAPNEILQLFLRAIGKIVPLFCMLYAGVQIFKHFGIV
jgi:hypothetical protein